MAYYDLEEHGGRIEQVKSILIAKDLDFAFVYYDEFNLGNGWYLTAWCPQFESGAVFVPREGRPMILGGPESEPFAKQDSAIKETRNLPVFMVPDEEYPNATIISFDKLFREISVGQTIKRVGMVGLDQMPVSVHRQIEQSFHGVTLVDITDDFLQLRVHKSDWERARIQEAFAMAWQSYLAMAGVVSPNVAEFEVAAAGEIVARKMGATSFAFKTIVGSGLRSNAVVPTAMDKIMMPGEMVMLGIAPRSKGYSGCFGHTVPVDGRYTSIQHEYLKHMKEVLILTRNQLKPGVSGREIDAVGRKYFQDHDLMKYLVCPFAHTIGIMEAEAPFFGPNSNDMLVPGMTVCVDVSLFGHPLVNGIRIETGYEITNTGFRPFSTEMESVLLNL